MRYFHTIFLIICFVSCKTKIEIASSNKKEVVNMLCPKEGTCSFEIIKNKNLLIKTDNLGSLYTEVVDGNHSVLKFEYKKHRNTN